MRTQLTSLSDSQQRQLLAKLLQEQARVGNRFPMSAGQQGLWHAYRRDPRLTAFNVFLPTRIRGPLSPRALEQSIQFIAKRHSALRTTFTDDGGQLSQIVHDDLFPEFACYALPGAADDLVRQRVCEEVLRPFDLERGPLLRISVYQVADDHWVVLASTHHIIVDFWSLIVILSELQQVYPHFAAGREPQLPAAADNYRDFVTEQEKLLASQQGERLALYWQDVLKGSPPILELPTDRIRPPAFSHRADGVPLAVDQAISQQVSQLATECRSTPFAVVHSAVQILLSRYSRQESFFIGSPFFGRSNQKYEQTVGFFINMLPVKACVGPTQTFRDLVQETTARLVDTLDHENFPVAEIARRAFIPRDPSRSPIFQVSCTFEKAQRREELGRAGFLFPDQVKVFDFAGLRQESFYIPHPTCHYDLEFIFEQTEDRLAAMLVYCRDLFDGRSMQQMADNFRSLLESLLQHSRMPLQEVPWSQTEQKYLRRPDRQDIPETTSQRDGMDRSECRVQSGDLGGTSRIGNEQFQTQSEDDELGRMSISTCNLELSTVDELILQAIAKNPDGTALQWPRQSLTYSELYQVALRLHNRIRAYGIQPNDMVPVLCKHGYHAFVAAFAVHLAGGAAVPVDLTQPSVDLERIIAEIQPACIVSDSAHELPGLARSIPILDVGYESLTAHSGPVDRPAEKHTFSRDATNAADSALNGSTEYVPDSNSSLGANASDESWTDGCSRPERDANKMSGAKDLAYMVYTSGSTGVPKGVMIEHGSILNTLAWRSRAIPLKHSDRVLMLLSHQFDAALGVGWSTLAQGATLVWPAATDVRDPVLLLEQIQRDQITVLPTVPSLLSLLVNHSLFSKCSSLHSIWTGGEALPADLPGLTRSRLSVKIWNFYGPTEAAVESAASDVTGHSPQDTMTIGKPIDGMQVLVVDSNMNPVPFCVPGELAFFGPGLARGYFGDPSLTSRRFVPHPYRQEIRIYLTGDLGRQLPDGRIEFLGRTDHQVKLRGFRIELGEIESALQAHPQVDRAAVVLDSPNSPLARLVAYVSPQPVRLANLDVDRKTSLDAETRPVEMAERPVIDVTHLRNFLKQRLAHYKLPAALVVLEELPTTISGKVDRKRLPNHRLVDQKSVTQTSDSWLDDQVPPRNELERQAVQIWCDELGVESVGIHQNFFEVGGSSLQAAVVATRLSTELGVHVPTSLLFDLADINRIASRLSEIYPEEISERFGSDCVASYARSRIDDPVPRFHSLLAPMKPHGGHTPLFMVHPPGGIVLCYRQLGEFLPEDQPLWAIRSRGLHGNESLPQSLAEMASEYVEAVQSVQPFGPYIIGGWSLGGLVAYEMARQLIECGQSIHRLIFLDTTIPEGASDCVPAKEQVNVGLEYGIELTLEQLGGLSAAEQLPLLYEHVAKLGILDEQSPPEVVERVLSDLQHLFHHHVGLSRDYRLNPIPVQLLLLRPSEVPFQLNVSEDRGWRHLVAQVDVRLVPGHHHSMIQSPHVQHLAAVIASELESRKP